MTRNATWILATALALAGCPSTPPAVDARAAQLAVVPDTADSLAQLDVPRIIDQQAAGGWLALLGRIEDHAVDASCVGPLLARAGTVTHITLPGAGEHQEEGLALISGDIKAADLAACGAALMGGAPPTPGADGSYTIEAHGDQAILIDLPGGGVAMGTAGGIALARATQPPAAPLSANPLLVRLRTLLPPGGEVDFYLLAPMGHDEIQVEAAAASLRRGTTDRYEFVLLAGSEDAASTLSMMAMGLPILIAQMQAMMEQAVSEPDAPEINREIAAKAGPVLDAVREALGDAQVTVEGDAVRVVLDLDPAVVGPTDLLFVAGMMVGMRKSEGPATGPVDVPAVESVPPESVPPEVVTP
ncbi:MAG: hypothetical protein HY905_11930 [Deltaproteobacteria bacterium]|nr:hypothetical protein [Deltaproteobacteria bacterium]